MNKTNKQYTDLLRFVKEEGEQIVTRNAKVVRHYNVQPLLFNEVPLVTVRKTAWKKALLEMEWFLSGFAHCPTELKDWWEGQLDNEGFYLRGYGEQLTDYTSCNEFNEVFGFDQIEWLINAIKTSPNSRRLIITTWHTEEMSRITEINGNKNTPTTCHLSFVQFFVSKGKLSMKSYNRSQDLLLG